MDNLEIKIAITYKVPKNNLILNGLLRGLDRDRDAIMRAVVVKIFEALEEKLQEDYPPEQYVWNGHQSSARQLLTSFGRVTDEEDELPPYAYRTSLEVYGKERAVVVTYNPRTYRKKIHWLSRTILKTKRNLQELRREPRTADGRTTFQSVEKKVVEILAEWYIALVFDVQVARENGCYRMSIRTDYSTIRDYRDRFGKNIIFTDQVDWATEEIIQTQER